MSDPDLEPIAVATGSSDGPSDGTDSRRRVDWWRAGLLVCAAVAAVALAVIAIDISRERRLAERQVCIQEAYARVQSGGFDGGFSSNQERVRREMARCIDLPASTTTTTS